ncbi:MAG: hypothetical protein GC134_01645 [Proteobacteria bacterium]|nr:hypothetical protein [Pseudomonadota bacterium]
MIKSAFSISALALGAGLLLALGAATASAQTADRKMEIEFRRLDQRISRLSDENERLMKDVRELQRQNEEMMKKNALLEKKANEAFDDVTRMRNTDMANLAAADKQIVTRVDGIQKLIAEETPTWNWGSLTRDCKDIGTHQQIQSVRSGDSKFTLRYLCFDGRAIHLGTELNQPPQ